MPIQYFNSGVVNSGALVADVGVFVENTGYKMFKTVKRHAEMALNDLATTVMPLYKGTIKGWRKHRPSFRKYISIRDFSPTNTVVWFDIEAWGKSAWLWNLINEGEETRTIRAKPGNKKGMMIHGSVPSTTPWTLTSRPLQRWSTNTRKFEVPHSVEARHFREQIVNIIKNQGLLTKLMRRQLKVSRDAIPYDEVMA